MSTNKIEELQLDIEELKKVESSVERARVRDILTIEVRKLETLLIKLKEEHLKNSLPTVVAGQTPSVIAPKCYDVKLTNYAWDQSDKFVKIFVTLKNVQSLEPAKISCRFGLRNMELTVKALENRNYILTITNLLENIDETKSYWKVKTDMVVVFLSKSALKNWSHLTASEVKAKEPKVPSMGGADEDPSAGLMNLMKKMYEEGDDDMKRTIAKAWTESRDNSVSSLK